MKVLADRAMAGIPGDAGTPATLGPARLRLPNGLIGARLPMFPQAVIRGRR